MKWLYRLKRKLGIRIHWFDILLYAEPEELSPKGKEFKELLDKKIMEALTNEKTSSNT